ncbi:uncharacterized protein LOC106175384 [Lingula anatina]|uniref:Uncharacterized protein LOC106175384 n=1 Tax=Lingula anatina TaxID=7574 RepID=A0A1S3JR38_LINAN|nr:uncharacterized protein LOC106175384 [Lingula anatina]|eukprot:XP_013412802.1 uncharacterized protein LOC106175384 [Lingula anatina]
MSDNTIQTQELTLIPGFESLGLRVNPQTNKLQIKYKKAVQFDIYKHQSGPHRSALLNLRAVFEYQDGNIYRSIELFEKSCKLDLTNLNALASLQYVYQEVGVSKRAAKYREKLEQLQGNPTCRARSFFEQGYMIAFDVFVEAQGVTGIQAHAYYLKALEMVHRKEVVIDLRELLECTSLGKYCTSAE